MTLNEQTKLLHLDVFPDGVCVDNFTRIKEISSYNYNYYSYKGKLLFGLSDDDCNTNYYSIRGDNQPIFLGYSDVRDEPETLHRCESEQL